MTPPVDFAFMVWGSAYVVLKWTVGLWTLRRVKVGFINRPASGVEALTTPGRRSQKRKV